MHTSVFLLTLSLFLGAGLVNGKPPVRKEALVNRQNAAVDACQSTCTPFLQGTQGCTKPATPACLCTASIQSTLQVCLNCLGSATISDSALSSIVTASAQSFNEECAGTATVTLAASAASPTFAGQKAGGPSSIKKASIGVLGAVSLVLPFFF